MKCLYWNINQMEDFNVIGEILSQENPDIFFLAETDEEFLSKIDPELDKIGFEYFENPGCERVFIIKKKEIKIDLGFQTFYVSNVFYAEEDLHIISVHLPSTMFQSLDALKSFIRRFRNQLDSEIGSSLSNNVLIIGDFNVNPFEKPMIDFDGFCSTNSDKGREKITHLGEEKATYYNPTWKLYNRSFFPGTKHFPRPTVVSYDILEHHFLDQVMISQHLKKRLSFEKIDILEKTKSYIFFDAEFNIIKISDHLPLYYEFTLK